MSNENDMFLCYISVTLNSKLNRLCVQMKAVLWTDVTFTTEGRELSTIYRVISYFAQHDQCLGAKGTYYFPQEN